MFIYAVIKLHNFIRIDSSHKKDIYNAFANFFDNIDKDNKRRTQQFDFIQRNIIRNKIADHI